MAAPYGSPYDFGGGVDAATGYFLYNSGTRFQEIHEMLVEIDPEEVPVLMAYGETVFETASPNWHKLSLAAVDPTNAHPDSEEYVGSPNNVPPRVQNVTQILRKTAEVSGTAQAERSHFNNEDKDTQLNIKMRELRRDQQYMIINSRLANVDEDTPRTFRGTLQSIGKLATPVTTESSNNYLSSRDAAAPGATGVLDKENFEQFMLKQLWDGGGTPTDVFLPMAKQFDVDSFSTPITRNVEAGSFSYTSYIRIFDSATGQQIAIHPVRDFYFENPTTTNYEVFAVDRSYFNTGYLKTRKSWTEERPKTGDYWRKVVSSEMTLHDMAVEDTGADAIAGGAERVWNNDAASALWELD